MASLTEISAISRNAIKYGIIGLIVLMLIPGAVALAKKIYAQLNPAPPPAPTVSYGKLPELKFPKGVNEVNPEYELQTIQGGLPSLTSVGKVYVVGINKARLDSLDKLRAEARVLGFTNDLIKIDDQNYKFIHPNLPAEITFNIITNSVSYRWDWTSDATLPANHSHPLANEAVGIAKNILNRMQLMTSELDGGQAKTSYYSATASALLPMDTPFDANVTRVDLFRSEKDKLPIVTAGGDTSPVNVIISGILDPSMGKRLVQLNYQFSPTLDNDYATYPLKPVSQAWDELKQGKGYVAKKAGAKVIVRSAYLGYFESSDPQSFLQPVFVFEGDGGFKAYVQAVDPSYIVSVNK